MTRGLAREAPHLAQRGATGRCGTIRAARRRYPCCYSFRSWGQLMQIRVGYELIYDCLNATPMILTR